MRQDVEVMIANGIIVKRGRYGGTYAFKDIVFEFGTAISVTQLLKLNPLMFMLKNATKPCFLTEITIFFVPLRFNFQKLKKNATYKNPKLWNGETCINGCRH